MENKKVITRSLIVLFLSLTIVYSLEYQKKEKVFKRVQTNQVEIVKQTGTEKQNQGSIITNTDISLPESDSIQTVEKTDGGISLGGVQLGGANDSNTQNSVSLSSADTKVKILSGTTEYFGVLDIVGILGEKPQFTLQDAQGNYFAYYGDHLNFIQTVNSLGGNVYEMVTEREIIQNQLFGDRVSYINLSAFDGIWVLMVIEIDGDVWLLQVPANKYHQSKDYLKSLFIQ